MLQLLLEGDVTENIPGDKTVANLKGCIGRTPFSCAAINRKLSVCQYLIESMFDIDINNKDQFGWTPLMNAVLWEHKEIAILLIKNNASTTMVDDRGRNALQITKKT